MSSHKPESDKVVEKMFEKLQEQTSDPKNVANEDYYDLGGEDEY